ncbi:hypothetical protein [Trichlorobacter lovleyi]|uniref:SAP domain-containing protein n=1 Tax=Trichlorobacter lovleyi (strain ATCC BAA-1151 / DSM 17278 / SZ) TaxID=398767 RepID=B3E231_TRIL1|nr:hypothetical protein [Trichlorobacter lovleyi]ACD97134.1 conserved hypothetical protein [Trichlorobacter lovleyi SZ]
MKVSIIREMAKERGIKAGRLSKAELIHSIQHAEGNQSCFGTGSSAVCGQIDCLWREDCQLYSGESFGKAT